MLGNFTRSQPIKDPNTIDGSGFNSPVATTEDFLLTFGMLVVLPFSQNCFIVFSWILDPGLL